MNQNNLKKKIQVFENINILFDLLIKIINWLCGNFKKDKKICEIIFRSVDGEWLHLEKKDVEILFFVLLFFLARWIFKFLA